MEIQSYVDPPPRQKSQSFPVHARCTVHSHSSKVAAAALRQILCPRVSLFLPSPPITPTTLVISPCHLGALFVWILKTTSSSRFIISFGSIKYPRVSLSMQCKNKEKIRFLVTESIFSNLKYREKLTAQVLACLACGSFTLKNRVLGGFSEADGL